MHISITECTGLLYFLAIFSAVVNTDDYSDTGNHWSISAGDMIRQRFRRTSKVLVPAVFNAMRAVLSLTKDATRLKSHGTFLQYEKLGSFRQAAKEFKSVHPTDIHLFPQPGGHYGATGRIGDIQITIKPKSIEQKPWPVMEIRYLEKDGTPGRLTHKIIYRDNREIL